MPDIVRALAISGGILLLVVFLTIIVSIVAVKRGALAMSEGEHALPLESTPPKETAAAAPAKGAKAAAASDEIDVLQILAFGVGLFVLAVLGLFALSVIQHM